MSMDTATYLQILVGACSTSLDTQVLLLNLAEYEKLPVRLSEIGDQARQIIENQIPLWRQMLNAPADEMTDAKRNELTGALEHLFLKATMIHLSTATTDATVHLSKHLFDSIGNNVQLSVNNILEYMFHVVTGEPLVDAEAPAAAQ